MEKIENNLSLSFLQFSKNYLNYLKNIFNTIDLQALDAFVSLIEKNRETDKRIFFIGNGGSASTASHFANDLGIGTKFKEKPLNVLSLCDNQSLITAVGNDYGFEFIFSKQLEMHKFSNEVLVCISVSGNSPNIIKAVEYAKNKGGTVVGLTGFDGGKLKKLSDIAIHVSTNPGEYGPTEDLHMIFDHLIYSYLLMKNENNFKMYPEKINSANNFL